MLCCRLWWAMAFIETRVQLLTRCCLIFMCSSTTRHGMMMTLTFLKESKLNRSYTPPDPALSLLFLYF